MIVLSVVLSLFFCEFTAVAGDTMTRISACNDPTTEPVISQCSDQILSAENCSQTLEYEYQCDNSTYFCSESECAEYCIGRNFTFTCPSQLPWREVPCFCHDCNISESDCKEKCADNYDYQCLNGTGQCNCLENNLNLQTFSDRQVHEGWNKLEFRCVCPNENGDLVDHSCYETPSCNQYFVQLCHTVTCNHSCLHTGIGVKGKSILTDCTMSGRLCFCSNTMLYNDSVKLSGRMTGILTIVFLWLL